MTVVESVGWRVVMMILTHLADPRIFAVGITVQLALETVVLNLGGRFAQVLVHFFVTDRMINFDTGLAGART